MMSSLLFNKYGLPLAEQQNAADALEQTIDTPYHRWNEDVVGEFVFHHKLLCYGVSQGLDTN